MCDDWSPRRKENGLESLKNNGWVISEPGKRTGLEVHEANTYYQTGHLKNGSDGGFYVMCFFFNHKKKVQTKQNKTPHYAINHMNLNKFQEIVKEREAGHAAVCGVAKSWTRQKQQQEIFTCICLGS